MDNSTDGRSFREKRGRKSATPAERLVRLAEGGAEAKAAAKEAEQRRCAIVGAALLAEARDDAALKAQIAEILRRRVTSAAARADIAALLI
jgi:hypothetical protein